jgi:hypothetical protein
MAVIGSDISRFVPPANRPLHDGVYAKVTGEHRLFAFVWAGLVQPDWGDEPDVESERFGVMLAVAGREAGNPLAIRSL